MTFDPVASRLVLLSQLDTLGRGSKVRFLACVHSYDVKTAKILAVDHKGGAEADVQVVVDVQNVLESLSHDLVDVGAWINIIGYVQHLKKSRREPEAPTEEQSRRPPSKRIEINAVMIWDAGAIRLDAYNAAVLDMQSTLLTPK